MKNINSNTIKKQDIVRFYAKAHHSFEEAFDESRKSQRIAMDKVLSASAMEKQKRESKPTKEAAAPREQDIGRCSENASKTATVQAAYKVKDEESEEASGCIFAACLCFPCCKR